MIALSFLNCSGSFFDVDDDIDVIERAGHAYLAGKRLHLQKQDEGDA